MEKFVAFLRLHGLRVLATAMLGVVVWLQWPLDNFADDGPDLLLAAYSGPHVGMRPLEAREVWALDVGAIGQVFS